MLTLIKQILEQQVLLKKPTELISGLLLNFLFVMTSFFNFKEQHDYNYCPSVEILGRPRVTQ